MGVRKKRQWVRGKFSVDQIWVNTLLPEKTTLRCCKQSLSGMDERASEETRGGGGVEEVMTHAAYSKKILDNKVSQIAVNGTPWSLWLCEFPVSFSLFKNAGFEICTSTSKT